jgi:hypothetical protein
MIFRFRFLAVMIAATGLGCDQLTFLSKGSVTFAAAEVTSYQERKDGSKRMTSDVVNTSMGYSSAAFKYSGLLALHHLSVLSK